MKILWLTRDRSHRVARIFEPLREAVAEIADVTVLERPAGAEADPPMSPGHEADVVLCDAPGAHICEDWTDLRERAVTAVLWEDMHGTYVRDMVALACRCGWFAAHFVRYYEAAMARHEPLRAQRVEWMPHCVDTARFRERGHERRIGALLTGRDSGTYPLRQRYLAEVGQEEWFLQVPRPAEDDPEPWPAGDAYADLLSHAQIGLSCTSRYGYPVLKMLEIPAAGALLATDWCPELDRLGFVDGVNAIRIDADKPVKRQLRPWINDPGQIATAAAAGRALAHAQHSAQRRARQLVDKLEVLL